MQGKKSKIYRNFVIYFFLILLIDVKNQVGALVVEVSEKILRRELSNKTEQESYIQQLAEGVKLN